MGVGLALLGLFGLVALASSGASSSRRRGAVTPQTRTRVRETLATPDATAATMPTGTPPAIVDPDRRTSSSSGSTGARSGQSAWAASRTSSSSGSSGTAAADMTFRVDANGRYPGEPGYIDPDAPPSGTPASMTITPPESEDRGSEGSGATEVPTTYDPDEARRLAAGTATAIRGRSSGWRNRLRAFQRAAGIPVDGRYGGLSYNALVYYGIRNPPPARSNPRPSAAAANYEAVRSRLTARSGSSSASAPAADMTFRPDAAGRYPGEPGYVDPDAPTATRASVAQGERRASTGATALAHDAGIASTGSES